MRAVRAASISAMVLAAAALCLFGAAPAFAATFTSALPAAGTTVTVSPAAVSVAVADTLPILGTPAIAIGGVAQVAKVTYSILTPGYWYSDDYENDYYVPPVYDYRRATVSCTPPALADGQQVASVTIAGGTAPKSYSWTFGVSIPPILGAVAPASGTTTAATMPAISVKASDNSGIASCSATIDGVSVPAAFDAPSVSVRLSPASIDNHAMHTAAVTVADAVGNSVSKTWSFTVNADGSAWSAEVPARDAVITTTPPAVTSAEIACTAQLNPGTRKVTIDGVAVPVSYWLNPNPSDLKRGIVLAYPASIARDGLHTVSVTVSSAAGTISTDTWSFTVRVAPTLGAASPAAASIVTTTSPVINVPAADNTAISSCSATVNGTAATATFDASSGKVRVTPAGPLPDDAFTTVAVSVFDAIGLRRDSTWTFMVQAGTVMAGNTIVCADCHAGIENAPDMSPRCADCHPDDHRGTTTSLHKAADVTACRPCHVSSLLVEHNRINAAGKQLTCASCHAAADAKVKAAIKAGDSRCVSCHLSHEAQHATPAITSATLAGTTAKCGDCHAANLVSEHVKPTSSTTGAVCAACHPTPRSTIVVFDATTCVQAGCHVTGTPSAMHGASATAHQLTSSGTGCLTGGACHAGSDLIAVHSNATATTASGPRSSCLVCHSDGVVPVSNDCASCHDLGSPHGDLTVKHSTTAASSTITILGIGFGSHGCSECHAAALTLHSNDCAKCHPSPANAISSWNHTCTEGGCHSAPAASPHPNIDALHSVGQNSCTTTTGCHSGGGNLAALHKSRGGCADCHAAGRTPSADCTTCHNLTAPHGDLTAIHAPTLTQGGVTVFPSQTGQHSGVSRFVPCANCHTTINLLAVHGTGANNCSMCHFGGARDGFTTWNKSCVQGGCHVTGLHSATRITAGHAAILSSVPNYPGYMYWTSAGWTIRGACWTCHDYGSFHNPYTCTTACHSVAQRSVAPPHTTASSVPAWGRSVPTTVTLTADDPGNVRDTYVKLDQGPWYKGTPPVTKVTASTEGTHSISYYSIDAADNRETTRTVNFGIDVTPPVTSNNATATYEQGARIDFTASDSGSGGCTTYVQWPGNPWWYPQNTYYSGWLGTDQWIRYYSVDAAGNAEAVKTQYFSVVDHLPRPDVTPPATTSNVTPGYPVGFNQQSIYLTANDERWGSGVKQTYYRFDNSGPWRTEQPSAIPVWSLFPRGTPDGTHTINYYSVDTSGNVETVKTSPEFIVDWTPPVITTDLQPDYYGDPVTIHMTTSDGQGTGAVNTLYCLDGVYQWDSSPSKTFVLQAPSSGVATHILTYYAYDRAGNWSDTNKTVVFRVGPADTTPPVTTSDAAPAYLGHADIALTSHDPWGLGVQSSFYRLDGGAWTQGTAAHVAGPTEGFAAHTLDFYSIDMAGNTESPVGSATFRVYADSLGADTTAPTTTSDALTMYGDTATIALTGDDAGGWGLKSTSYSVDGGPWTEGTSVIVAPPLIGAAHHTLTFYSTDWAGNNEIRHTVDFSIHAGADLIAPTTICYNQTDYWGDASVALIAADNVNGWGLDATHYKLDAGAWVKNTPNAQNASFANIAAPSGGSETHTIAYYSTDLAGNAEGEKSATFVVNAPDTIAPTTTVENPLDYYNGIASIDLIADDGYGTGIDETFYILDGAAPVSASSFDIPCRSGAIETHTLTIWSLDNAGNTETRHTMTFKITPYDFNAPTTSSDAVGSYTSSATIFLSATDDIAGVRETHYTIDGSEAKAGDVIDVPNPASGTVTHAITFWSVDNVGNTEGIQTRTFDVTHGGVVSRTFAFSGGDSTFTVPNGVTQLSVDMYGAQGGGSIYFTIYGLPEKDGGFGGRVRANLPVTPGAELTLRTGGAGEADTQYGNENSPGGYPTGGNGFSGGGGGGGSSSILVAGNVVLEAGGGGGTSYYGKGGGGGAQGSGDGTGNQRGADSGSYDHRNGGGGGGWDGGATGSYWGDSGTGGTSFIAVGSGALTQGVRPGDGSIVITWSDGAAPVTTSDAQTSYTGLATIAFSATDANTGGAGIDNTYYSLDGAGAVAGVSVDVDPPAYGSAPADHTLAFWSVDRAGNVESQHIVTFTVAGAPDTEAPTTTSDAQPAYTGAATIVLSPTDVGSSGVASTHYILDDGTEALGTTVAVVPPRFGSASHTLKFWSVDVAGNPETSQTVGFTVAAVPDNTPPVTTSNVAAAYDGPAMITLSADDAAGSGVATTYYSLDGAGWTEGALIAVPAPDYGIAYHSLRFYSVDMAGNTEADRYISFIVENPFATTLDTTGLSKYEGATVAFQLAGAFNSSFVTYYRLDGSDTVRTYAGPFPVYGAGQHAIEYWSTDTANGAVETHNNTTLTVPSPLVDDSHDLRVRVVQGGQPVQGVDMMIGSLHDPADLMAMYDNDTHVLTDANGWAVFPHMPGRPGGYRIAVKDHLLQAYFYEAVPGYTGTIPDKTLSLDADEWDGHIHVTVKNASGDALRGLTVWAEYNDGLPGQTVDGIPSTTVAQGDRRTAVTGADGTAELLIDPDARPIRVCVVSGDAVTSHGDAFHLDHSSQSVDVQLTSSGDTTKPATTSSVQSTPYWGAADVGLSATDNCSVAATYWELDGLGWTQGTSIHVDPPAVGTGSHTLRFYSVDGAGNTEDITTQSFTVGQQDWAAPVTTSDAQPSYSGAATINLTATDAVSGVQWTHYSVDGGAETAGVTVSVTAQGPHTLEFWSADNRGNVENERHLTQFVVAPAGGQAQPFSFTGADASFTVPDGVTALSVDLYGGQGGSGDGNQGGFGGSAHAEIPVTPGTSLTIRTGGHGTSVYGNSGSTPAGGWPNGGNGLGMSFFGGGAGGGSSAILSGTSVLVEAGGGGGGGSRWGYGGAGGWQGSEPGGNLAGQSAASWGVGGGGGGWNPGSAGVINEYGGSGGSSYIASGTGALVVGTRQGDGWVVVSWVTPRYVAPSVVAAPTPSKTKVPSSITRGIAPLTTTSDAKPSYTGTATISFVATGGSGSGAAATYYALDGGTAVKGTAAVVAQTATGTQRHTLRFWSVDAAGTTEAPNKATFDILAP